MSKIHSEKKDPLMGLALIMYSMDIEQRLSRVEAFRFVLEGACGKLGITQDEVRAYLGENLERVKAAYNERNPAR